MLRLPLLFGLLVSAPSGDQSPDQAAIPLQSLKLNLDALTKWGTRKYTFGPTDQPTAGIWTLTTKVGEDSLVLEDQLIVPEGGQANSIRWRSTCSKNGLLSLKALECEEKTGGSVRRTIRAVIEDAKARIEYEQDGSTRKEEVDWPATSVTELGMFRIVTLLPREEGKRYRIENYSRSRLLRMRGEHVLECKGLDQETEKAEKWTKFELKSTSDRRVILSYWVSDDGVLQRGSAENETFRLVRE